MPLWGPDDDCHKAVAALYVALQTHVTHARDSRKGYRHLGSLKLVFMPFHAPPAPQYSQILRTTFSALGDPVKHLSLAHHCMKESSTGGQAAADTC